VVARFTLLDVPSHRPGRVARVDRGSCLVATADGPVRASPYTHASRRAGLDGAPATGDWVALVDDPQEGTAVVGVVPRWSAITRKDPDERVTVEQVLAANVDVFAVVCGLDRSLSQNRVERMLSVGWRYHLGRRAASAPRPDLVLDPGILKLHLSDHRRRVLESFAKRLRTFGERWAAPEARQ